MAKKGQSMIIIACDYDYDYEIYWIYEIMSNYNING